MPNNKDKDAIMIDFSCTGIGFGMSDVGMHIAHAIHPCDLINGGEERLIAGYISALEVAINRIATKKKWHYPKETAMRHYRLACVDYLRFVMGRFWRNASPESFHKGKDNKNVTLFGIVKQLWHSSKRLIVTWLTLKWRRERGRQDNLFGPQGRYIPQKI
jgi:hypothetical protein